MISILFLLFLKHFIVDFPLQTSPYLYLNKGIYGHPGGIIHSGLHAIGTFVVLLYFTPITIALLIGFIDGLIHYHIDWAKVKINKKMNWGPTTHNEFWILMGFDQFLHTMTYLAIVWAIFLKA